MSEERRYPRRLIEVDLPIKEISAHARKEKSIRHGHISTLHIWWARRPLAACRAVTCAALWLDPADPLCPPKFRGLVAGILCEFAERVRTERAVLELAQQHWSRWNALSQEAWDIEDSSCWPEMRQSLLDFIAEFANWEASANATFLATARALTSAAAECSGGNVTTAPMVVDPFAGGGAIPLEALRVGATAYASDLNPIPVLLNKVLLNYIPHYGIELSRALESWGKWVQDRAAARLQELYPKDSSGRSPIAYIWARTIACEGPGCGATIPVLRSGWLSKRQSIALEQVVDKESRSINYVVTKVSGNRVFSGTVKRGSVTCPCCKYTTPRRSVEKQIGAREHQYRLLAVVVEGTRGGKDYRVPEEHDYEAVRRAGALLSHHDLVDLIPDEKLPYLRSIFNVHVYGIRRWRDLFSARQAVAIAAFVRAIRDLEEHIVEDEPGLAEAVRTCLGLALDRLADFNTTIARWANHRETSAATFGRQALGMVWDFCETVPLSNSTGSWIGSVTWIRRVVESLAQAACEKGHIEAANAASHPLPDDSAQLLFTDPPYYDAVPYANLSDFFYVWLRRSIGDLHAELFTAPETPKQGEAVQLAERNPEYAYKTKEYFEELLSQAFKEGRRYVEPGGLGVIVFAHKATDAWESLLAAVVNAGWVIKASWPIDTEMANRLRARNSAALGSSVHIVCRPRENADGSLQVDTIGNWTSVLRELPQRIHEWMPRLAEEGIVGADAIFACIGPALEIFSRYSRVEKVSGDPVGLREYLEHVWAAVAREALSMIFEDADMTGLEEDARLTAMWLWTLTTGVTSGADSSGETDEDDEDVDGPMKDKVKGGYVLEFDAARKIAQGLGAHLEDLKCVAEIKGDKARLLSVAERAEYLFGRKQNVPAAKGAKRKQMSLFAEVDKAATEEGWGKVGAPAPGETTLDRMHQAMLLFAAGRGEALKRFLVEEGIGRHAPFWKLGQSLSALYPPGSEEKRWVDGVLARKKGLGFG